MVVDIVMPRLSDSMEEGVVLKWLKSDGDTVNRDEDLVEIETDKANMTYASDTAGVLIEIVAEEGAVLPVGEVIARIETDGQPPKSAGRKAKPPVKERTAGQDVESPRRALRGPSEEEAEEPAGRPAGRERAHLKVSPIARRLARESGLDLGEIEGSGPGGRIVKADVEAAAKEPTDMAKGPRATFKTEAKGVTEAGASAQAPAVTSESATKGEVRVVELTRLQQTVARRMSESKATAPHFNLQIEVDMTGAVSLHEQLKDVAADHPVPSYNDMAIKAAALALQEFPQANGAYRDGRFELYSRINIGVAVASRAGLTVPTLFDANQKSLGEIAKEARALAERVRSGRIAPPDLSGGTFTVSNLGMFGIDSFSAVINPPQAAILAVGAVKKQPTVNQSSGQIEARNKMSLILSCDHRILYGAEGAEFLGRIRAVLEEPLALTL